jgi:protein gp37
MSDLFHERLSNEAIAAVFGVMAASPMHTFLILTKRPERAAEWFEWVSGRGGPGPYIRSDAGRDGLRPIFSTFDAAHTEIVYGRGWRTVDHPWMKVVNAAACQMSDTPIPWVWLGTSVENQETAGERIPHLLRCPAAVRFVSYEPALAGVDFTRLRHESMTNVDALRGEHGVTLPLAGRCARLDWIIVGGESGPGARPLDLAWARSTVEQCREAGVACFVKQLGGGPLYDGGMLRYRIRDRKGGDPTEWPEDLRVREWPKPDCAPRGGSG